MAYVQNLSLQAMILDYKKCLHFYTVNGKGDAVVLLHGFLETSAMWNSLTAELSKNNCVVCIDLLGHGQTDCMGYVHSMDAMAEAVLAILSHLKIKKAQFVGHSMGGYVALALAEKHPEFFEGLCLMNATFEADTTARIAIRTRAIEMAKTNLKALVGLSFANLFTPENKITYKTAFENALAIASKISTQGYIAAQEGMIERPNRFEVFKNLKAKKLIIIGKKDSVINSETIRLQIKNTPINYCVLSEGHMSYIENKVELSNCIRGFIGQ